MCWLQQTGKYLILGKIFKTTNHLWSLLERDAWWRYICFQGIALFPTCRLDKFVVGIWYYHVIFTSPSEMERRSWSGLSDVWTWNEIAIWLTRFISDWSSWRLEFEILFCENCSTWIIRRKLSSEEVSLSHIFVLRTLPKVFWSLLSCKLAKAVIIALEVCHAECCGAWSGVKFDFLIYAWESLLTPFYGMTFGLHP